MQECPCGAGDRYKKCLIGRLVRHPNGQYINRQHPAGCDGCSILALYRPPQIHMPMLPWPHLCPCRHGPMAAHVSMGPPCPMSMCVRQGCLPAWTRACPCPHVPALLRAGADPPAPTLRYGFMRLHLRVVPCGSVRRGAARVQAGMEGQVKAPGNAPHPVQA